MKNIVFCLLLACCTGCGYSRLEKTVLTDPPVKTVVEHITFLASEKVGNLYYLKDAAGTHFEMGDIEIKPVDFELQAYRAGIQVGKAIKGEEETFENHN